MDTLSSSSSSILSLKLPRNPTRRSSGLSELRISRTRPPPPTIRSAVGRDGRPDFGGGGSSSSRSVDESMIVLRRRIDELRAADTDTEGSRFEWTEWEKEYYEGGCYGSDVCQVVGLIQSVLMRTRPGVPIALLAILLLSVPTSTTLLAFHLLRALRSVF